MRIIFVLFFLLSTTLILGQEKEKINFVFGGVHGFYAGYGNYNNNAEYNINLGYFPTDNIGLKGDYLFKLGKIFSSLDHKAGFTGGIIWNRTVANPTFLEHRTNDTGARQITSLFGGLLYQIGYKNLYLQAGVIIGSQNYRNGAYLYQIGYAVQL